MKKVKVYFDKSHIARKLGINPEQMAFGQVDANESSIEFTILMDDGAKPKLAKDAVTSLSDSWWDVARVHLSLFEEPTWEVETLGAEIQRVLDNAVKDASKNTGI